MNKKISIFLVLLAAPAYAFAQANVDNMMAKIQSAFLSVGISIVVIGWVIAGILYLTAAGAPERVKTAKTAVFACVIGTALIILAEFAYAMIRQLLGV